MAYSISSNIIHIILKYTTAGGGAIVLFMGGVSTGYAAASSGIPLYPKDRVILRRAG